jgi:hypothetical protein
MLAINAKGQLLDLSFTNQTLSWDVVYQFNHCRRGKVIARLVAEDQDWYHVELAEKLETTNGYMFPGERFPIRKSLVFSVELS